MLKIFHLSESDFEGGAARAAFRINAAINNYSDINSIIRVNKKLQEFYDRDILKSVKIIHLIFYTIGKGYFFH